MDFVGNSYNGYLVTDQKMDYHGTCKTTQLKDFVAFSIILSEIEFLVRI